MRAYKNQYGWSTKCKGKDANGNEISCYVPIYFYQCEPSGEEVTFEATDWFMSAYPSKNGVMPKMIVRQWQKVVTDEPSKITSEELPF